jgi:hypothetical protein
LKKLLFTAASLLILIAFAAHDGSGNNPINKRDCSYKGITLYGTVQVVTSFPDIKVQVVSNFPDLKVEKVGSFPDKCGKWQFVDSFPDFKIQYVKSFPDIKIEFVSSFPGVD